ncbi:MAG: hypothetical protein BWY79_00529 [Actinobacteria bacterium ADurb.Bin444]|nr:MAG: hypothetical protein BWY79_00529 [Actinobacteria bacterium ADurb.Bin444]
MMPSVAALLGRWFWWPLNVREHPARASRVAVSVAAHYRGLTPQELRNIARSYADLALHWNPKELGAAELRARLQTSD